MNTATWSELLPAVLGPLTLGGQLRRTEPGGACPAPVAIVGLYPAVRGYDVAKKAQVHLYGPAIDSDAFGVAARVVHCRHPGVFIRAKDHKGVKERERWCAGSGKMLVAEALKTWSAS